MKFAAFLPLFFVGFANAQHNWGLSTGAVALDFGTEAAGQKFDINITVTDQTDTTDTDINITAVAVDKQNFTQALHPGGDCTSNTKLTTGHGLTIGSLQQSGDDKWLTSDVSVDFTALTDSVWNGTITDTTGNLTFCYVMQWINENYVMNYIRLDVSAEFDLTKEFPVVNNIAIEDRSNEVNDELSVNLNFTPTSSLCDPDNAYLDYTTETAPTFQPGEPVTICVMYDTNPTAGVWLDEIWEATITNNNTTPDTYQAIDLGVEKNAFTTTNCQLSKTDANAGNNQFCYMTTTLIGLFFEDTSTYDLKVTGTVLFKLGTFRRMEEINLRGLQADANVEASGEFAVDGITIERPEETDDSSAAENGILLAAAALSAFALI